MQLRWPLPGVPISFIFEPAMSEYELRYYYPYEERYSDISRTPWQKFNSEGVIVAMKERLKDHYKISKETLYPPHDQGETYYHPVLIANCILGNYNLYLDRRDQHSLEVFWNNIRWLANNGVAHKDALVFPFPYGLKEFNPEPNWVSGMYQGQILSCFARAYHLSGEQQYLELCRRTRNSFDLELGEKYGFRSEDRYGLWFEEAPKLPANHILNGAIFALWGIYDYFRVSGERSPEETWKQGVRTILNALDDYDLGFWSLYDLSGTITSYYYQSVHVKQMTSLFEQTGDEKFRTYAEKWASQLNSTSCRLRKKIYSIRQDIRRGRLGLSIRNAIRGTR
jgi:heparosan-N-sulfate-glucuronate 5-epimerase